MEINYSDEIYKKTKFDYGINFFETISVLQS